MSNVVQLFPAKKPKSKIVDTAGLVETITDWAESQGVNIADRDFQTRCSDLVIFLEIMAREG